MPGERRFCDRVYATPTLRRIFLRIWIFEIRNELAQKLRLDSEYFLGRPSTSPYQYFTNNTHALPMVPMAYQCLRKSTANYRLQNISWKLWKQFVLLLSNCGECSCEDEFVISRWVRQKNGDWIVEIFISVSPLDGPRSALSLSISYEYITNAYQRLPMPLRTLPTLTHALSPVHASCECECDTNVDVTNSHRIIRSSSTLLNSLTCEYRCERRVVTSHLRQIRFAFAFAGSMNRALRTLYQRYQWLIIW